eukprot:g6748.t1
MRLKRHEHIVLRQKRLQQCTQHTVLSIVITKFGTMLKEFSKQYARESCQTKTAAAKLQRTVCAVVPAPRQMERNSKSFTAQRPLFSHMCQRFCNIVTGTKQRPILCMMPPPWP